MNKTSDYVNYHTALNAGSRLLSNDKKFRIGFYIILAINTGLRISDILELKHIDLNNEKLIIVEKKTKKRREITINNVLKKSYLKLTQKLNERNIRFDDEDYIFISQKGSIFQTQSINSELKKVFKSKSLQISSHSLRKSFARRVYTNLNESENALVLISDLFNHSNISISRRYLSIRAETISNIYQTL